ncbi:SMP-30/gluconolactonase/LRE family protein [Paenibacillus humicola]|uniref:SMP-30/gluconolactonase/LRE family protein n=1 Tax=Paenibacillus humicola TaxID=3110540 RepID=UPI00237BB4E1|nr:SMP-30/gluconolactonase/LRE family protein [Paenibacillus humicola]
MEWLAFTDEMNTIVPDGAVLERLGTGYKFLEGPVWDDTNHCLYFSDIPADTIYRWSAAGGFSVFRSPSLNANGLTLDGQGRLLACEHSGRKLSRGEADGTVTALASHYGGKRLNSPNDVVVHADGSIYFTDPPYGLNNVSEEKELLFQGVYRYNPETEGLRLLADDFDKPNGLAFSPDKRKLYVDDTGRDHVRVFDVTGAGDLVNGSIFAEIDPDAGRGGLDGMKTDLQGRLYVTGHGGVWIISPSGEKIGVIKTPEIAANLAWGEDGQTLFVTASTSLYKVRLNVLGMLAGRQA